MAKKKKRTLDEGESGAVAVSAPETAEAGEAAPEPPVLLPADLLTRPRTLTNTDLVFFRWLENEWYGASATWNGHVGIAFLPHAHYHAAQSVGIAPQDVLASHSFFMSEAQYRAETEPFTHEQASVSPAPVVQTIGMGDTL